MRLSNNALNFLNSAYRNLYQRAYITGLSSSVVLSAVAFGNVAQAEDNHKYQEDIDNLNDATNYTLELSSAPKASFNIAAPKQDGGGDLTWQSSFSTESGSTPNVNIKNNTKSNLDLYADNIKIENATATITNKPDVDNIDLYFKGNLDVNSGGSLTLENVRATNALDDKFSSFKAGTVTVNNGGELNIHNSYINAAKFDIKGTTRVYGANKLENVQNDLSAYSTITTARTEDPSKSSIDVNDGANFIVGTHGAISLYDNSSFNLNGGTVQLQGAANTAISDPENKNANYKNILDSKTDSSVIYARDNGSGTTAINFNGGNLIVGDGSTTARAGAVAGQKVNFNGSNVEIQGNATFTLHSAYDVNKNSTSTHLSGAQYTLSSGSINNHGTLNIFTNKDVKSSTFTQTGGEIFNTNNVNIGVKPSANTSGGELPPQQLNADANKYIATGGKFTNTANSNLNIYSEAQFGGNSYLENSGNINVASGAQLVVGTIDGSSQGQFNYGANLYNDNSASGTNSTNVKMYTLDSKKATLDNSGTVTIGNNANFEGINSTINNHSGANFTLASGSNSIHYKVDINNSGDFIIASGAKLVSQAQSNINNEANLDIQGQLNVESSANLNNNKTLTIQSGGAVNIASGGIFTNNSTTELNSGTVTINSGTFTNTSSGTVNINSGSSFGIENYSKLNNEGTINLNSGGNFSIGVTALDNQKTYQNSLDGKHYTSMSADTQNLNLGQFNATSGTVTLKNDLDGDTVVKANELLTALGITIFDGSKNTRGNSLVLDNVTLELEDKEISIDKSHLASGDIKATARGGGLLSDKIDYTVSKDGNEDLKGLDLIANNLNFKAESGSTIENGTLHIAGVSGAHQGFVAQQSLSANSGNSGDNSITTLHFSNANLGLNNKNLDYINGSKVDSGSTSVDLVMGENAHLSASTNNWQLKNVTLSGGSAKFYSTLEHARNQNPLTIEVNDLKITQASTNDSASNPTLEIASFNGVKNANELINFKANSIDIANATAKINNANLEIKNAFIANSGSTIDAEYMNLNTQALDTTHAKDFTAKNSNISVTGDNDKSTVDIKGNINLHSGTFNFNKGEDTVGLTFDQSTGLFVTGEGFNKINAQDAKYSTGFDISLEGMAFPNEYLTTEQAEQLAGELFVGNGLLNISGIEIEIPIDPDGTVDFKKLAEGKDYYATKFENEKTKQAIVVNMDEGEKLSGGWKAMQANSGTTSLGVTDDYSLSLYGNLGPDKGNNIVGTEDGKVVGLVLGSNATLKIEGSGNIGKISGGNTYNGSAEFNGADIKIIAQDGSFDDIVNIKNMKVGASGNLSVNNIDVTSLESEGTINSNSIKVANATISAPSVVNVASNFTAQSANIEGTLNSNDVTIDNANIKETGVINNKNTFTAQTANIEGTLNSPYIDIKNANINGGTIKGANNLNAHKLNITNDSVVEVRNINIAQNGNFNVGTPNLASGTNTNSAQVYAQNIKLNGNTLILANSDQANGKAKVLVNTIGNDNALVPTPRNPLDDNTANNISFNVDGNLIVSTNSVLGFGNDVDAFNKSMDSVGAKSVSALVYANRSGIYLNKQRLAIGNEDVSTLNAIAQGRGDVDPATKIYFGKQSGLHVTAKSFNDAYANNNNIFSGLTKDDMVYTRRDLENDKNVTFIVPANTTEKDLAKIFGSEFKLNHDTDTKIWVQTENGLYGGWITSEDQLHGDEEFDLDPNTNPRTALHSVSNPTYKFILDVQSDSTKHYQDDAAYNAANRQPGANGIAVVDNSTGYAFYRDAIGSINGGKSLEQALRLSTLAGSMQSTVQATDVVNDMISKRLSNSVYSTNQGLAHNTLASSVWFNPIYSKSKSDSFNANGVGYGADVDLYGLALGADTLLPNTNVRLGAMFNIGSGSSSGNGVASGISNDFNFYGLSMYAAMSPLKNLQVNTNLSYNRLSHDVDANSDLATWGKLNTSTDSSALRLGAEASYDFAMPQFLVSPHAGLYYTRYEKDGSTVKIDNQNIASNSNSHMDILSMPFGVKLSKEFKTTSGWLVKPEADLNLTLNLGDTAMAEEAAIDGIYGKHISYNTDVIDKVTFGASFGVSFNKGNLDLGVGLDYNGSSNTSEFGLNAQAKYRF